MATLCNRFINRIQTTSKTLKSSLLLLFLLCSLASTSNANADFEKWPLVFEHNKTSTLQQRQILTSISESACFIDFWRYADHVDINRDASQKRRTHETGNLGSLQGKVGGLNKCLRDVLRTITAARQGEMWALKVRGCSNFIF